MADHNANGPHNGDFEQGLLREGVSESTLERLRKEEISEWSTLAVLTSDDLSELGLPLGQKALIRKLIQNPPSFAHAQNNVPHGQRGASFESDQDRVAARGRIATEYVSSREVSNDDDLYDDAISLSQNANDDLYEDAISLGQSVREQTSAKTMPSSADVPHPTTPTRVAVPQTDVAPTRPPRKPIHTATAVGSTPQNTGTAVGSTRKNTGSAVGSTPRDTRAPAKSAPVKSAPVAAPPEVDDDIYDVPIEEEDDPIADDLYDVPDNFNDDVYDEPSLDNYRPSPSRPVAKSEPRHDARPVTTPAPRDVVKPAIASEPRIVEIPTATSDSTSELQIKATASKLAKSAMTSASKFAKTAMTTASRPLSKSTATSKHVDIVIMKAGPMMSDPVAVPTSEFSPESRQSTKPPVKATQPSFHQSAAPEDIELPPRRPRSYRSSGNRPQVHFPDEMLTPVPDDDIYEAPIDSGDSPTIMPHESLPDEEAPDIPGKPRKPPHRTRSAEDDVPEAEPLAEDNSGDHEVALSASCMETEGKGKIILELTTAHLDVVKPLPARILLLVDTSGSMGIKVGRRRRSKLNRLKNFVQSLVKTLDDGDQAALVTFGDDTSVMLPMSEINERTQDTLTRQLDQLDRSFLSTKTDLSAGLLTSLDVFGRVCKSQKDLLSYRNSIIVFSDGEINLGTQEPRKLVHEVREKIRAMSYGLDDSQNQWVSISTVVTGSSPSEIMFAISKFCSSDAFYHLDTDKESSRADVDFFLPVMMRKTAIAWNVSLHVESLNGATIINSDCTQENKVRLRNTKSKDGEKTEKAYFFYDIPVASEKHVGIVLDLYGVSQEPEVPVLMANIHFTGISGKRRYVTREITRGDLMSTDLSKRKEALEDIYMHEARILSHIALSKAAEDLKSGYTDESQTHLKEGQSELQKLMESYGQMAEVEDVKIDITPHAESVIKNLQSLLDAIESASTTDENANGKTWIKMKAVSSAITREAPTTSDTVEDTDILCPLPNVRHVASENIRKEMIHVYKKQGVRNSSFINMDHTIQEMSTSRMRPISE